MKLAILYSGGKDSNYALLKASRDHEIVCLINLKSENENSYMFQSAGRELIELQSEALNIPLLTKQTKGVKEKELIDLKNVIEEAIEKYKIEGIVTGAIESCYQASRIQSICNDLDIYAYNPLWQINPEEFLEELQKNNFNVILAGVFSYPLNKSYLGRELNKELIEKLNKINKETQISLIGEGGEYESLVLDSPLFKKRIQIKEFEKVMDSENSGQIKIKEAILVDK